MQLRASLPASPKCLIPRAINNMHTIRLKRPWKRLTADSQSNEDLSGTKVDVPDPEGVDSHAGKIHYQRSFNRPPQLEADEKLVLQIDHFSAVQMTIELNDAVLCTHQQADTEFPLRVDLTTGSAAFNRLNLVLESPDGNPIKLDGAVCLLIGNSKEFLPSA